MQRSAEYTVIELKEWLNGHTDISYSWASSCLVDKPKSQDEDIKAGTVINSDINVPSDLKQLVSLTHTSMTMPCVAPSPFHLNDPARSGDQKVVPFDPSADKGRYKTHKIVYNQQHTAPAKDQPKCKDGNHDPITTIKDQSGGVSEGVKHLSMKPMDLVLPVFPLRLPLFDGKGADATMGEQCLRQWTRSVIGKLCGVDPMTDLVVYHVLAFNYQVSRQKTFPDNVRQWYRELALLMLRKKRTVSGGGVANVTELKRLQDGELPTPPNGDIEYFKRGMRQICPVIGLSTSFRPFTVWYLLCQALNDHELSRLQFRHCLDDLVADGFSVANAFPTETALARVTVNALTYHPIPTACGLEATCLITLEDLSKTGGHRFLPHGGGCRPRHMLGDVGLKQLLANPATALCPVCYSPLTASSFARIDPEQLDAKTHLLAPIAKMPILFSATYSADAQAPAPTTTAPATTAGAAAGSAGAVMAASGDAKSHSDVLLFLRGTVGGGKSTYCAKVCDEARSKGYTCFVASVDRYACVDNNAAAAIKSLTADLSEFLSDQKHSGSRLVVVDTCGETTNAKKVFGQDLSSWKIVIRIPNQPELKPANMARYLDWSLCNVLSRPASSKGCGFWLNPAGAGLEVCKSVHLKKALAVFGKKVIGNWKAPNSGSKQEILDSLKSAAQLYVASCPPNPIDFL